MSFKGQFPSNVSTIQNQGPQVHLIFQTSSKEKTLIANNSGANVFNFEWYALHNTGNLCVIVSVLISFSYIPNYAFSSTPNHTFLSVPFIIQIGIKLSSTRFHFFFQLYFHFHTVLNVVFYLAQSVVFLAKSWVCFKLHTSRV